MRLTRRIFFSKCAFPSFRVVSKAQQPKRFEFMCLRCPWRQSAVFQRPRAPRSIHRHLIDARVDGHLREDEL
jgi:hypothetical protein